jgi:AraC-like DNA-binding protein
MTVAVSHAINQAVEPLHQVSDREGLWEQAMRERFCSVGIRLSRDDRGAGKVASADLADLMLTEWDCPPIEGYLSSSTLREEPERDVVVVIAGHRGEELLSFGGTQSAFGPGALLITSSESAGRGSFAAPQGVRKRTLLLPRAALMAAEGGLKVHKSLALAPDRPLVSIFNTFLDKVWKELPEMTATEAEATRTALVALVAGIVRSEGVCVSDQSALPALRAQLERSIEERLRHGPVRLEDLAAVHRVSTRTIHRAFALTGDTMKSVVRAQRLAAVRQDLLNTNLTIARIAHRWTYYDASHLGKEFREVFGISPREYRQRYTQDTGGSIRSIIDHRGLESSEAMQAS